MQPEEFQKQFNVSRESLARFDTYYKLLLKWQKAINLVSPGTLDQVWSRHFADSAQLASLIPAHVKIIADLGSGAGFPGLVLAIFRPDLDTHLIESDERKAQFLKNVSRETATPVTVHDRRVEEVRDSLTPDLITARALAPLDALLGYVLPWAVENPALTLLFLKGKNYEAEVEKARAAYQFDIEIMPSLTDREARLLKITALARR